MMLSTTCVLYGIIDTFEGYLILSDPPDLCPSKQSQSASRLVQHMPLSRLSSFRHRRSYSVPFSPTSTAFPRFPHCGDFCPSSLPTSLVPLYIVKQQTRGARESARNMNLLGTNGSQRHGRSPTPRTPRGSSRALRIMQQHVNLE